MMLNRRLAGLLTSAPCPAALSATASLLGIVAILAQTLLMAEYVSDLIRGVPANERLLLAALAIVCLRAALRVTRQYASAWTAERVKDHLRRDIASRVTQLGPLWLRRKRIGDVQTLLGDGVDAVAGYVGYYLPQLLVAVIGPAILILAMAFVDPLSAIVIACCVAAVPAIQLTSRRLLGRKASGFWNAYEEFAASSLDALRGITTLKLLGAADRFIQRLDAKATQVYRASTSNLVASGTVYLFVTTALGFGAAGTVALSGYRYARGDISLFAVIFVLLLAVECFRPLIELQNYWHEGFSAVAVAPRLFALLDTQPDLVDGTKPAPKPSSAGLSVELVNVSYRYSGTDKDALRDVTLSVPPGRTLGLVGVSGSGKSTVFALLQRFDDPQGGEVRIGDVPLSEMPLRAARCLTSVVSQNVHLFSGTVRENLLLARPDATEAELNEALALASAADMVHALPDGLDTPLGERGLRLSGGQRQRIAIARAVLVDAPVLLLDEATSSLDSPTEQAIQAGLASLRAGRTTIVIAHRLSTVMNVDRVAVLFEGRIPEQGSPDDLLASDGYFAELVGLQRDASNQLGAAV